MENPVPITGSWQVAWLRRTGHPALMELLEPSQRWLPEYAKALQRGWAADNLRPEAANDELDAISRDPGRFIAKLNDRSGQGDPVTLPDGSQVQRLPGTRRWIWQDGFCGSIGLRWQPGTEDLPPYCSGHIGYAVVPWRRGEGLASAALVAMLADARAVGLRHVDLTTSPDNPASIRVIEKAGGAFMERFRMAEALGGRDALRYRISLVRA